MIVTSFTSFLSLQINSQFVYIHLELRISHKHTTVNNEPGGSTEKVRETHKILQNVTTTYILGLLPLSCMSF